jgi:hypothetical protein
VLADFVTKVLVEHKVAAPYLTDTVPVGKEPLVPVTVAVNVSPASAPYVTDDFDNESVVVEESPPTLTLRGLDTLPAV